MINQSPNSPCFHNSIASSAEFENVFAALLAGRAVVLPTDTVYGLAVSLEHAVNDEEIFRIKKRPKTKPIAWLIPDVEMFESYALSLNDDVRALAQHFWPGALTIIVPVRQGSKPCFVSSANTVGFRIPHHEALRALMRRLNSPLAASSANISGDLAVSKREELNPVLLEQVAAIMFDEFDNANPRLASTVIDCSSDSWRLLREGSVSQEDILTVLPQCRGRFAVTKV